MQEEKLTKKCPFCAEEIKAEAVLCKYCKKEQPKMQERNFTPKSDYKKSDSKKNEVIAWVVIAIIAAVLYKSWFITLPLLAVFIILSIFVKTKLKLKLKLLFCFIVALVLVLPTVIYAQINKTPTIEITQPNPSDVIQGTKTTIEGTVSPAKSTVSIKSINVQVGKNGHFSYDFNLPLPTNTASVVAKHGKGTKILSLTVARVLTDEEKAEQGKLKAEAEEKKKVQAEAAKKAAAEQANKDAAAQKVWDNSKAGKICKANEDKGWSKEDCQSLADGNIWVGMTFDMLVYKRGRPNSSNPSNYGRGNEWQWCWYDWTPSCFYGHDDGIVDSYN